MVTRLELFCLAIIFNLDLSVWHSLFLESTGRLVISHERQTSLLKNAGDCKREESSTVTLRSLPMKRCRERDPEKVDAKRGKQRESESGVKAEART